MKYFLNVKSKQILKTFKFGEIWVVLFTQLGYFTCFKSLNLTD